MTTRTCLRLPDNLGLADWMRIGEQIFLISEASTWWLGDWLVFGEDSYPGRYRHAVAETRLDYGTLRNYSWVARRFEPSRRRNSLSFSHHMEVAGLRRDEQEIWLGRAAELNWSKSRLRAQIRQSREAVQKKKSVEEIRLQVAATPDQWQRWRGAAKASECDVTEWVASVLDNAARATLDEA